MDFEYEIAFSFLNIDLNIAKKFKDSLSPTSKVFLYSEEEKKIMFKNGTEIFSEIYKSKSRLVIVLYRDGYGLEGFTKIEKEALLDRRLLPGDMPTFGIIKMDNSPVASWIPNNYIYGDYNKIEFSKFITIIEHKIRELNGSLSQQDSISKLRLYEEFNSWKSKEDKKYKSFDYLSFFIAETHRLITLMQNRFLETFANCGYQPFRYSMINPSSTFGHRSIYKYELKNYVIQLTIFMPFHNSGINSDVEFLIAELNSNEYITIYKDSYRPIENNYSETVWVNTKEQDGNINTNYKITKSMNSLCDELINKLISKITEE